MDSRKIETLCTPLLHFCTSSCYFRMKRNFSVNITLSLPLFFLSKKKRNLIKREKTVMTTKKYGVPFLELINYHFVRYKFGYSFLQGSNFLQYTSSYIIMSIEFSTYTKLVQNVTHFSVICFWSFFLDTWFLLGWDIMRVQGQASNITENYHNSNTSYIFFFQNALIMYMNLNPKEGRKGIDPRKLVSTSKP